MISENISVVERLGDEIETEETNKSYRNINKRIDDIKSKVKGQYNLATLVTEGIFPFLCLPLFVYLYLFTFICLSFSVYLYLITFICLPLYFLSLLFFILFFFIILFLYYSISLLYFFFLFL